MPGESLSFDITANDRASSKFRDVGRSAADASVKMDLAAASLKVFDDSAVKAGKAATTSQKAFESHAKAAKLLADTENVLAGRTAQYTKLTVDQVQKLDEAGKSAEGLAGRFSALAGSGGIAGGGMGALIGAGVALSPILLTLGTGLAGLAAAAYGVAKPIENAAQKTGGLAANLKTLDPEQRKVATGILALGHSFGGFEQSLKPEVLGLFNTGLSIAGHLLHDVQPVAKATGVALQGVLGSVDKEFQSGTWQQFFSFMAKTAGPDMQLLGRNLTDLLQVIPPLTEDLQPLATGMLMVSDDAVKAAGGLVSFYNAFQKNVPVSNQHTLSFLQQLDKWTVDLTNHIPGAKAVNNWLTSVQHNLLGTGAAAAVAAHGTQALVSNTVDLIHPLGAASSGLSAAHKQAAITATDLQHLNTQLSTAVTGFLALPGATTNAISTFKTFESQSKKSGASLTGVNQASLTLQNTLETGLLPQTQDLITKMVNAHQPAKAIATVFSTLVNPALQIGALRNRDLRNAIFDMAQEAGYAGPNKVKPLRDWIDHYTTSLKNVPKAINTHVGLTGTGAGHITFAQQVAGQKASGYLEFHAAGGLIKGGTPGRDSVLGALMPGELVVPTPMVRAGAVDHLRGRLPGFAAGGLVDGSRSTGGLTASGNPTSGGYWMSRTEARFGADVERAFAAAAQKGLERAVTQQAKSLVIPGGLGGNVGSWIRESLSLNRLPGWWAPLMAILVGKESGGNPRAYNPISVLGQHASGIAQMLPSTFASYTRGGSIWNPIANLVASERYIEAVYGNPRNIRGLLGGQYLGYDSGGWLPPGRSLVYNGTGRPEQVLSPRQSGGGTTVVNHITVRVGHGTNPVAAAQELAKVLNQGAKSGVKLRTSILGPG